MLNFGFMLEAEAQSGNWFSQYGLYIVMFALLIGIIIWNFFSSKKQRQKEAEVMDKLAPGDEVTTIGGIIGKVVSIKEDTFVLETTKDKTKIRFLKAAIKSVDVKAADIAAAIIADKKESEAEAEESAEENN